MPVWCDLRFCSCIVKHLRLCVFKKPRGHGRLKKKPRGHGRFFWIFFFSKLCGRQTLLLQNRAHNLIPPYLVSSCRSRHNNNKNNNNTSATTNEFPGQRQHTQGNKKKRMRPFGHRLSSGFCWKSIAALKNQRRFSRYTGVYYISLVKVHWCILHWWRYTGVYYISLVYTILSSEGTLVYTISHCRNKSDTCCCCFIPDLRKYISSIRHWQTPRHILSWLGVAFRSAPLLLRHQKYRDRPHG